MYKETLSHIDGISTFPVIAILIFMVFFLLVLYFTFKVDKSRIQHYAALPIEGQKASAHSPISSPSDS